jgi:hypothetical protein
LYFKNKQEMARFISFTAASGVKGRINVDLITTVVRTANTQIDIYAGTLVHTFTVPSVSTDVTYNKYLNAIDEALASTNKPISVINVDFVATTYVTEVLT